MAFNETISGLCFPRRSHFIDKFWNIRICGEFVYEISEKFIHSYVIWINRIQIKLSLQWEYSIHCLNHFSLWFRSIPCDRFNAKIMKRLYFFVDVHIVKITCLAYQFWKGFFFLVWWSEYCDDSHDVGNKMLQCNFVVAFSPLKPRDFCILPHIKTHTQTPIIILPAQLCWSVFFFLL